MVGAAAAEVRLGDQRADLAAELVEQGVEFLLIRGGIERCVAHRNIAALGHRERDEAHARVALACPFRCR